MYLITGDEPRYSKIVSSTAKILPETHRDLATWQSCCESRKLSTTILEDMNLKVCFLRYQVLGWNEEEAGGDN
jgi:hypothetical protein